MAAAHYLGKGATIGFRDKQQFAVSRVSDFQQLADALPLGHTQKFAGFGLVSHHGMSGADQLRTLRRDRIASQVCIREPF